MIGSKNWPPPGLLAREACRALAVPLRFAAFLAARGRWRARTARALAAGPPTPADNDAARRALTRALGGRRPRRILLACGEASGENLALEILRAAGPLGIEWFGFGGPRLAGAGFGLEADLVSEAVMGLAGVLGRLGYFAGLVRRFEELLARRRPDAVVLVDNPGLNLVLAERARAARVPVIGFVCPQYWAWGPWRVRRYAAAFDLAFAILPFEPAFFSEFGIAVAYAGHPIAAATPPPAPGEDRPPRIALLPGARPRDRARHLAPMLEAAAVFARSHPGYEFVVPQPAAAAEALAAQLGAGSPDLRVRVVTEPLVEVLQTCRAALAKSGTTTIQCALAATPCVILYRLAHAWERWFRRAGLTVPWIGAPNLVLGREAFKEVCGRELTTPAAAALTRLIDDAPHRGAALRACAEVRRRLGGSGSAALFADWLAALT